MDKKWIQTYSLPVRKPNESSRSVLLPYDVLTEMKSFMSPNVVNMTLRAVDRASLYDCKHTFWNAFANCYIRITARREALLKAFPALLGNSQLRSCYWRYSCK
jgi:hypothetical protein